MFWAEVLEDSVAKRVAETLTPLLDANGVKRRRKYTNRSYERLRQDACVFMYIYGIGI